LYLLTGFQLQYAGKKVFSVKEIIQKTTRLTAFCAMFLLIPMMFLSTVDVTGRKLLSNTVPGTMELSSYMLALFILLGLSYTHQRRAHVRVTLLVERLPKKAQLIIEIVLNILSMLMLAVLIKEGWVIALEETTVSDMLRIPENPFRMALVIGCSTFFLELLIDIWDLFQKLRRK
jgi:TRAP-type C4-dicarboxylate transport system permease small subunit